MWLRTQGRGRGTGTVWCKGMKGCAMKGCCATTLRLQVALMDTRVENTLAAWERSVAADEKADPIWNLHAYRVARCLVDHVQCDAPMLVPRIDPKTMAQLSRAVASIGANVAEGYSRRSAADRSRFYGYALGSAREATLWYRSVAWCLDGGTIEMRMAFLTQERRLLVGMLKSVQRHSGAQFEPS